MGKGSLPEGSQVSDQPGGPRFADQRGARAALSLSFLAASALYLLLAAACSPALPGVLLLFASRLPSVLMHTLPGETGRQPAQGGGRVSGGRGSGPRRGVWAGAGFGVEG